MTRSPRCASVRLGRTYLMPGDCEIVLVISLARVVLFLKDAATVVLGVLFVLAMMFLAAV